MTDTGGSGCITRFVDGPCGNPPTSGLPICGSCLRTLLEEADPRRRRTLAAGSPLAAGVIQQLAEDPDDQVRAQVAARDDLDTATVNRLAHPDRESAPIVWRSIAATPGGATHAWELLGTDDAGTLTILAANRRVDPDILDQLARYPHPDVSWTASATLAGQPTGDVVAQRLREARVFDGLPIGEPAEPLRRPTDQPPATVVGAAAVAGAAAATPPGVTGAGSADRGSPPPGTPGLPPRPAPEDDRPSHTRTLLVGAGALVVLAAVVLVVAFARGNPETRTKSVGASADATTTVDPTTTRPPTTTSTTSAATTTVPPTTTAAPTWPPTTPAPPVAVTPPPESPISQNFTIRPDTGRFCKNVAVTVNFSPAPAYVVITDDTGAQVGGWTGASGQTKNLQLPRATSLLVVNVTAVGRSISVSGNASGESC